VIPNGWSQTTTLGTTTNAFGAPIPYDWEDAFVTNPVLEPVGNAKGPQTGLGTNITFFNQNPKVSKQLRWQIGFQHELPGDVVVEAAYVGNYGYDIEIFQNINAIPNQYLSTDNARTAAMNTNNSFLTASVTNPFAGLLPGTSFNSATIARSQLLRPFPAFGDIYTTNNDGKSWYHAGQLSVQKRFAKGYTLGLAYTYSHWMQATEYLNAGDPRPTKMISDLDVPHRLSLSAILEVPCGKGRRFLSEATGITQALFGGWQVQGVYTFQSGFPVPFGNPAAGTSFPPTNSDVFYSGADASLPPGQRTTVRWFNTDAFTSILNSTSTNATPVNHLRTFPRMVEELRRDPINNLDLAVIKNVSLPRDMQLQLRAEFINALNSPYFPNPVVSPTSTTFGQVAASNQANYARRAQIGVKLVF
jgi:hypothetical protein